jgi:hypothetical protein
MISRSNEQTATARTTEGRGGERVWVAMWMAVVALSPLAAGGAAPGARVALALFVLVLGGVFLAWSAWRKRPVCLPIVSGVMVVAGIWSLLQTRLPAGPLGSPLHAQVTEYLGEGARISLAPVYAPAGALVWFALAMALVLSSTLFSVPGRLSRGWLAVAAAGWVTVLVGLIHRGLGWRGLYGLSVSDLALPNPHSAPFVNANQAGSLLALSVAAGALLAGSSSGRWTRAAGVATVVGLLPAVVWMRAGSAAAGLLVCAFIGGLSWLVYRQIGVRAAIRAFWGLLAVICTIIAVLAWVVPAASFLPTTMHPSLGKSQLWNHALTQILRAPWTGTGYGSSGDVLAGAANGRFEAYYTMVESQPLQLALDMGIPFALLVMAAFMVPLVRGSVSDSGQSSQRRRLLLLLPLSLIVVDSLLGVGLSALAVALSAGVLAGSPIGFAVRSRATLMPSRSGWLWGAVGVVVASTVVLTPGLPRAVQLARQPWPTEWLTSPEPPTVQAVHDRAAQQPALLTVWFVDALVSQQSGDAERAALIRRLMSERAPDSLLTRRLRLSHALQSGDHVAVCADLRALAVVRRNGLDTSVLEPDVTRWYACIPDEEPQQQWWFEQLQRSSSGSQVLSTALVALRESTVPWIAARAAAVASRDLGFDDEATFFAAEYGRLAPQTEHHILEALDLAMVVGQSEGARRLVQRSESNAELAELLELAGLTLDADDWWRGSREPGPGTELQQRLDALRSVYLFDEQQDSLFLAVRAMVAYGLGQVETAAALVGRALNSDPQDRRALAVRAALRRENDQQTN